MRSCCPNNHQVKCVGLVGSNLGVIASSGLLDNSRGSALRSSLHQLIGLCVEDKTVFIADCQQGSIKLLVKFQVDSLAEFLASMGFVAKAFGMYLPNQLDGSRQTNTWRCQCICRKNASYMNSWMIWRRRYRHPLERKLSLKVQMALCLLRQYHQET